MRYRTTLVVIILLVIVVNINGCKSSGERSNNVITTDVDTSNIIIKYDGSLFPIPSSWETTRLIKKFNLPFDEKLIAHSRVEKHTTSFKQALNLGILGTDVNYLNMYDEIQESVMVLSSIKLLCSELGLGQIFDENVFVFIEKNINRPDSITNKISNTYAQSDNYLKSNDRSDIGSLIISGAWVESMYILTQIAMKSQNRDIINRIGEQKVPLHNLIELLTPFYYKSEEISELVDEIIDLNNEFEGIIYSYTYRPPTVIPDQKLIIINSQSRIVISDYHLQTIGQKIMSLRNRIVN